VHKINAKSEYGRKKIDTTKERRRKGLNRSFGRICRVARLLKKAIDLIT
jgi:hypothetical protein